MIAAEAKSAATVATDFFKALKRFGADIEGRLPHLDCEARVVYGGEKAQQRSGSKVLP